MAVTTAGTSTRVSQTTGGLFLAGAIAFAVVPPLAASYVTGDATTRAALTAVWRARRQFGVTMVGRRRP
ncbi:hypothetical protein ACQPXB_07965 [Amycolatopsis sp. CA-161197]|uniref:hypothetical protein n=1 Tax=unclassified Amycolatopsis TaxID=2618356 RepID=UPI0036A3FCF2